VRANDVCARCGFVDAERVFLFGVMVAEGGSVRVGGLEVEWCVEWDCHTCTVHAVPGRGWMGEVDRNGKVVISHIERYPKNELKHAKLSVHGVK